MFFNILKMADSFVPKTDFVYYSQVDIRLR